MKIAKGNDRVRLARERMDAELRRDHPVVWWLSRHEDDWWFGPAYWVVLLALSASLGVCIGLVWGSM